MDDNEEGTEVVVDIADVASSLEVIVPGCISIILVTLMFIGVSWYSISMLLTRLDRIEQKLDSQQGYKQTELYHDNVGASITMPLMIKKEATEFASEPVLLMPIKGKNK